MIITSHVTMMITRKMTATTINISSTNRLTNHPLFFQDRQIKTVSQPIHSLVARKDRLFIKNHNHLSGNEYLLVTQNDLDIGSLHLKHAVHNQFSLQSHDD